MPEPLPSPALPNLLPPPLGFFSGAAARRRSSEVTHSPRREKEQPQLEICKVEMRLLTHNMLASNVRGVTTGYPLKLEATNWCIKEVELNADFIKGLVPKIDWRALVAATRALDLPELLPEEQPPVEEIFAEGAADVEGSAIRRIHHALLEIHVQQGALVCPESGRTFPIEKGIPNMMLHEDEI